MIETRPSQQELIEDRRINRSIHWNTLTLLHTDLHSDVRRYFSYRGFPILKMELNIDEHCRLHRVRVVQRFRRRREGVAVLTAEAQRNPPAGGGGTTGA